MKRKCKIPKFQMGSMGAPKRKYGDVPSWYNPLTSKFEEDYFPLSEGVDDIYAEQRNQLKTLRDTYKTKGDEGSKQLLWDFEHDFTDMLENDSSFAETNTDLVNLNNAQKELQSLKQPNSSLEPNLGISINSNPMWNPTNNLDAFQSQGQQIANQVGEVPYIEQDKMSEPTMTNVSPYTVNQKPLNKNKVKSEFGFNGKNFGLLQGLNAGINSIGNLYNNSQNNQSIINQSPLSSMQYSNGRSNQSKYGYSFQKGGYYWDNEDDDFLFGDEEDTDNNTINVAEESRVNDEEVVNEELQPQRRRYDMMNDPLGIFQFKKRVIPKYQPVSYENIQPSENLSLGNQQAQVYSYLQSKGLTKEAIAGIMGNIQHESNFNPGIPGDNGTSFGLFQHHADRKNKLFSYLKSKSLPLNSVQGHIDFAIMERPDIIRKVNSAKTPQEAADIWVREFEVPANVDKQSQLRQKASLNYYQQGGTKINFPKFNPTIIQQKPIIENTNPIKKQPIIQQIMIDPKTGLPMTQLQADMFLAAQRNQNQGKITKTIPTSTKQKIIDIVSNPMTSTQQLINKQPVTGRGPRNIYDYAIDIANPITYAKAIKNTVSNVIHPIETTKKLTNTGLGVLGTIVGDSNTRPIAPGMQVGLDALMTAQAVKTLNKPVQTVINNTYKINPWQYKPKANKMFRGLNKEGFDDAIKAGVFRSKQNVKPIIPDGANKINLAKQFGENPYFTPKFNIAKSYGADYIAEVPRDVANWTNRYKRSDWSQYADRMIPISEGKILKKHWLMGYKEIPKPTSSFKSEIDWSKWNKEIPENKALMQEYNAIDYRKNPLSDKEKEMYQWLEEQMRFDKLPQTTNKQSIEVLDNFKQRIRTPEGQKRLKELGITEEQLLQDLKIVEDPNTYGYYRGAKNTIAMNPNHPLPRKVVRHEIEHGVQNALRQSKINKAIDGTVDDKMKALEINTTEIDDILSGLILRREGTPNKVWGKINTKDVVDINNYKSLINNKQNATDYFLTGSDGAEKSAFLGEVQQYMMDTGKIPKGSYVQITPEMVKETMIDAMFDEAGGGKYLRLFNIIKADPKNYELISKGLNKMLTIGPLIGAGAYMQNKEYKNGGTIGNNGMFDMTNPNIYKALFPAIIGAGALQQKQKGGIYDNNGYLTSNLHNFTPKKIINSNHITTQGMAFPIIANNQVLYPNTGDYIFPTNRVVEKPLYLTGGIHYVDNATLINLKQKGIKFKYV